MFKLKQNWNLSFWKPIIEFLQQFFFLYIYNFIYLISFLNIILFIYLFTWLHGVSVAACGMQAQ